MYTDKQAMFTYSSTHCTLDTWCACMTVVPLVPGTIKQPFYHPFYPNVSHSRQKKKKWNGISSSLLLLKSLYLSVLLT